MTFHLRYVGCTSSCVPPPLIMLNKHALNNKPREHYLRQKHTVTRVNYIVRG